MLLAGCQDNPEPPPLESTAPSAEPSPTDEPSDGAPTVEVPTLPPKAEGTSPAAAKAFVRHWVDVLNYAGPAGDGPAIGRISDPQCGGCMAIRDFIDEVEGSGGEILGEGWQVNQLRVVTRDSESGQIVIDATVTVRPQEVRPSAGATPQRFGGGERLKTFWLEGRDNAWTVVRLDQPT